VQRVQKLPLIVGLVVLLVLAACTSKLKVHSVGELTYDDKLFAESKQLCAGLTDSAKETNEECRNLKRAWLAFEFGQKQKCLKEHPGDMAAARQCVDDYYAQLDKQASAKR
jgi:hypothetical protein